MPRTLLVLFLIKKRTKDTPAESGPFVVASGKRVFNDARAQAETRSANAMRLAYASFAIAALSISFGIVAAKNPRPVPHVVLVNNDGRGVAVRPISEDVTLRDKVAAKQITSYVRAIFTRTGSYAADRNALATDVGPMMEQNDPSWITVNGRFADPANNLKTADTLATVQIDNPQKRADDSWYVKWSVTTTKPTGERISVVNYDVSIVSKFRTLATEAEQDANPTGLDIVAFPFQTFSGSAVAPPPQ